MANYQMNFSAPSHFVKYTVIFLTLIGCLLAVGAYSYLHVNGYLDQNDESVGVESEIDITPLTAEERVSALDSIKTTAIKPATQKTNQILDKLETKKSATSQEKVKNALDSLK